jgi:hypothetical protein
MAVHIWVMTAFFDVPRNERILKFCLIHLKNSSICQRDLWRPRA